MMAKTPATHWIHSREGGDQFNRMRCKPLRVSWKFRKHFRNAVGKQEGHRLLRRLAFRVALRCISSPWIALLLKTKDRIGFVS
jgi:hypothetical protein